MKRIFYVDAFLSHVSNFMLTLVAVVLFVACERHTPAWERMDVAENIMNAKPDSALAVLEGILASDVKGKETAARYALLKSMALDKNYIDTTTFDVLQPAIDYYIKKGTPDEQLRTYYYQGRIYQNKGDKDSAMQCFIQGREFCGEATDTMTMANLMVAQATIQYMIYKLEEFIQNNLESAKLYHAIGRIDYEVLNLVNAIDGGILTDDKHLVDSVMAIAQERVKQHPELSSVIVAYNLSYALKFGNEAEVVDILRHYESLDSLSDVDRLDIAAALCEVGNATKAKRVMDEIGSDSKYRKSLKYLAVMPSVLEQTGDLPGAMQAYKEFYSTIDSIHQNIFSHDLLFAEKKHQLEMDNIKDIQSRDRIILGTLCGILVLLLIVGWLYYYYRGYLNKMEAANLRLEISQLESERDNLKELQREQSELAQPVQDVIKDRLDMLNCLLAKEITQNESYAKPYNKWIESVRNDKNKFMDSTRLALTASHPKFIGYLEQHGLSTEEINYLCLYAIGLRGKEVGEYIQLKRHYNISSEIRRKLGIDEHETNIGLYVRKLMKSANRCC